MVVILLAIIFVLSRPLGSYALLVPTLTNRRRSSPRRLRPLNAAFGNILGNKETQQQQQQQEQLPKDVKDAVTKCRQSVQRALGARISRMEIEMPVGANFGIEDGKQSKSKRSNDKRDYDEDETGLTMTKLDKSNRELARLFVEMFQPLGGRHICAIFNTEDLADEARLRWSNNLAVECNIVAIDRKGRRSRKGGSKPKKKVNKGFAAILAEELDDDDDDSSTSASGPFTLPKDTEVAIFISPGPRELIAIERICNDVGMGTCVILLNARLSSLIGDNYSTDAARTLFTQEFEPVWTLTCAPQDVAPGCLLHRAYPGTWILARKPKVGPPKTIATKTEERLTMEEFANAYSTIEVSELEKTSEKFAENVMGWFK